MVSVGRAIANAQRGSLLINLYSQRAVERAARPFALEVAVARARAARAVDRGAHADRRHLRGAARGPLHPLAAQARDVCHRPAATVATAAATHRHDRRLGAARGAGCDHDRAPRTRTRATSGRRPWPTTSPRSRSSSRPTAILRNAATSSRRSRSGRGASTTPTSSPGSSCSGGTRCAWIVPSTSTPTAKPVVGPTRAAAGRSSR